ncbi:MAG: hypothetical protein HYY01_07980 [Chloroflexi bacterium]|nr:hypothetical protein [Chloroflexota bacterium]
MDLPNGTPSGIHKSSRHSKIIGDLGERLICNWLSRSGFEVAILDHTGLDIIAAKDNRRLGITVKSRTRSRNPNEEVTVFKKDDAKKLRDACTAFNCEPWVGIYVETQVETQDGGDVYLTSVRNYESKYLVRENKQGDWKMTARAKLEYGKDPDVMHIAIQFDVQHWFAQSALL